MDLQYDRSSFIKDPQTWQEQLDQSTRPALRYGPEEALLHVCAHRPLMQEYSWCFIACKTCPRSVMLSVAAFAKQYAIVIMLL
jgi:hypothetical protein